MFTCCFPPQIGAVAWDVIVYDEASCLSNGIVNIRAARTLADMQTLKPPVMFGITSTALERNYKALVVSCAAHELLADCNVHTL
eukprot:10315-Heterococcus_DN1.PRE.4